MMIYEQQVSTWKAQVHRVEGPSSNWKGFLVSANARMCHASSVTRQFYSPLQEGPAQHNLHLVSSATLSPPPMMMSRQLGAFTVSSRVRVGWFSIATNYDLSEKRYFLGDPNHTKSINKTSTLKPIRTTSSRRIRKMIASLRLFYVGNLDAVTSRGMKCPPLLAHDSDFFCRG